MSSLLISGSLIVPGIPALFAFSGIRIINQYGYGVVFRFGCITKTLEPGFRWIIPVVDRMVRASTRIVASYASTPGNWRTRRHG